MKPIWFNMSVVILALGSFEAYLYFNGPPERMEGSVKTKYRVSHDILGYAPWPNSRVTARKYYHGELLYDVVYTIDSDGLRISPDHNSDAETPCIVFFGCSVTFGEGVNDVETMPYHTGMKTNGVYRIYNFGFHGYGPHQMLAALEKGLVERIVRCKPQYVIYQAIMAHIPRTAGRAPWDRHGPKYVLSDDDKVTYMGHFDDERNRSNFTIGEKLNHQINKSLIVQAMAGREFRVMWDEVKLFMGIVHNAEKKVSSLYKESEFHVIVWNYEGGRACQFGDENMCGRVITELRRRNMRVHLISDILKDDGTGMHAYHINKYDLHPNAVAHERIAQYVVDKIIKDRRQGIGDLGGDGKNG